MILDDLFTQYIQVVEVLHSQKTLQTTKGYFKKHIRSSLGKKDVKDINYLDIQLFINNLLKLEYKPKTCKNILSILKVLYKFAMKLNYVSSNPCDGVELPKFDNTRYFNYPLNIQKAFIKAIINNQTPITNDIFLFLLHGRRKSEVLELTWDLVDLEQKLYYIPAKINKAKKNMSYKMTDLLYARLQRVYLSACIFQNTKYPKGYVFLNPNTNKPYKDLRKAWKRLLNENDLPIIRLHDIRHLLGTFSINFLNLPIEHVSYMLGHSDISITQKYITIKPEISKEVIDKVFLNVFENTEK